VKFLAALILCLLPIVARADDDNGQCVGKWYEPRETSWVNGHWETTFERFYLIERETFDIAWMDVPVWRLRVVTFKEFLETPVETPYEDEQG
jgi:hypothetical protein